MIASSLEQSTRSYFDTSFSSSCPPPRHNLGSGRATRHGSLHPPLDIDHTRPIGINAAYTPHIPSFLAPFRSRQASTDAFRAAHNKSTGPAPTRSSVHTPIAHRPTWRTKSVPRQLSPAELVRPAEGRPISIAAPIPQRILRAPLPNCMPETARPIAPLLTSPASSHHSIGDLLAQPDVTGMSSSAPLPIHTAGRHGRKPTACNRCRSRRQGCTRDDPCQRCIQAGLALECLYSTPESTFGPSRSTPRQRQVSPYGRIKGSKLEPTSELINKCHLSTNSRKVDAQQESLPQTITGPSPYLPSVTSARTARPPIFPMSNNHSASYDPAVPLSSSRDSPYASTPSGTPPSTASSWKHSQSTGNGKKEHDNRFSRYEYHCQPAVRSVSADDLMEEGEVKGVGSRRPLRHHRGQAGEEERIFFGTSHFGPQLAAKVTSRLTLDQCAPPMPFHDMQHLSRRGSSLIDDAQDSTLVTQIRKLLPLLPRKEQCDRHVEQFFKGYNDHVDILHQADFLSKYERFWERPSGNGTSSSIDLRFLAIVFLVLAIGVLIDHDACGKLQSQALVASLGIDGERRHRLQSFLGILEKNSLGPLDREDQSLCWTRAARTALTEASGFYGESLDTVRAGALLALYYINGRRMSEGWTAIGTAIRAAQAQGMHVDGGEWSNIPPQEAELRRRLWLLFTIDRSVSLFLGRPLAISDGEFTSLEPANIIDEQLQQPFSREQLAMVSGLPEPRRRNPFYLRAWEMSFPTRSTFLILHFRLAAIIGYIQISCFGLPKRTYASIEECEGMFQRYRDNLPPHFRLDYSEQNRSLDHVTGYEWLVPQRQTLISKFHLARISLHRPYLLRSFKQGGPDYTKSREACISSSVADLHLRTTLTCSDPLDRFKWMTVASGFNPAVIIGILCLFHAHDPRFDKAKMLGLVEAYIEVEERTVRRDDSLETELHVLRMMVDKAKNPPRHPRQTISQPKQSEHHHPIAPGLRQQSHPSLYPVLFGGIDQVPGGPSFRPSVSPSDLLVSDFRGLPPTPQADRRQGPGYEQLHAASNGATTSSDPWLYPVHWARSAEQFPNNAEEIINVFDSFTGGGPLGPDGAWNESPVSIGGGDTRLLELFDA